MTGGEAAPEDIAVQAAIVPEAGAEGLMTKDTKNGHHII